MTEPSSGAPDPAPAATSWGTPAAAPVSPPVATGARDPYRVNGLRTSIAAAVIMVCVVGGANVINAAAPAPSDPAAVTVPAAPQDPGASQDPGQPSDAPVATLAPLDSAAPGQPSPPAAGGSVVDVGLGVLIHLPGGWTQVDTGSDTLAFQKSGVVLTALGLQWSRPASDLATRYRDAWFKAGTFTADDPQSGAINGIDAAVINYTGVLDGTQVDGSILAAAKGGTGLALNFFGGKTSLTRLADEINTIVSTFEITGVPK